MATHSPRNEPTIAATIEFLKNYWDNKPIGSTPAPGDFIRVIAHLAEPGQPTLQEQSLTSCCIDDFTGQFSKAELLQAFDISVKGARKELSLAKLSQEWNCCFSDVLQMVVSDGKGNLNPQLRDLTRPERSTLANQLEQLATENERKATELSVDVSIVPQDDEIHTILKLLKCAHGLRDAEVILEQAQAPQS